MWDGLYRKRMKHLGSYILLLIFICFGCERVVDIQETAPEVVEYCDLAPELEGLWLSDSVHIRTEVDTIDSVMEERNPTVSYAIEMGCMDTSRFLLSYTNFAGVRTEDVRSSNFQAGNGMIYVFNAFDASADTSAAGFDMRYELEIDTSGVFRFEQMPNPNQKTSYTLYMRKSS
jgi:hypothetical protein